MEKKDKIEIVLKIVQTVAIFIAAIWGLYIFITDDRKNPRLINIDFESEVMGEISIDGRVIQYIRYKLHAENTGKQAMKIILAAVKVEPLKVDRKKTIDISRVDLEFDLNPGEMRSLNSRGLVQPAGPPLFHAFDHVGYSLAPGEHTSHVNTILIDTNKPIDLIAIYATIRAKPDCIRKYIFFESCAPIYAKVTSTKSGKCDNSEPEGSPDLCFIFFRDEDRIDKISTSDLQLKYRVSSYNQTIIVPLPIKSDHGAKN